MGPGGKPLQGAGGGNRAGGDRLPVNAEETEAAGEQPAVSASLLLSRFSLFPTVDEQIEAISQAQTEERQEQLSFPAALVSEAVIGRALTGGGNEPHSIERIVAFFQKEPIRSDAAAFLEREFGEGGRGVSIAGQDYALWFSKEGFRIAQGRSAFGPGSTLVSWADAAAMTAKLLRDGQFASQDRIDAAPDNEFRELAEKLWYLCHDFSDAAKEQGLLLSVESVYRSAPGFPDGSAGIAELLKDPVKRQNVLTDLHGFMTAYEKDAGLLRFTPKTPLSRVFQQISELDIDPAPFRATKDFVPVTGRFTTEDEVDHLLIEGPRVSESKLQIYAYFAQGHSARECAVFLRNQYGDGGFYSQSTAVNLRQQQLKHPTGP